MRHIRRYVLCWVHLLQVLFEPLRVLQLVRLLHPPAFELVSQKREHRGVSAFFPA
jgi:hypothetical protein